MMVGATIQDRVIFLTNCNLNILLSEKNKPKSLNDLKSLAQGLNDFIELEASGKEDRTAQFGRPDFLYDYLPEIVSRFGNALPAMECASSKERNLYALLACAYATEILNMTFTAYDFKAGEKEHHLAYLRTMKENLSPGNRKSFIAKLRKKFPLFTEVTQDNMKQAGIRVAQAITQIKNPHTHHPFKPTLEEKIRVEKHVMENLELSP